MNGEVAVQQAHHAEQNQEQPQIAGQKRGVGGQALDAQGPVGDGRQVDDKHPDDFGKAQGGDAEIVAAQAQHGKADEQGDEGRRQTAEHDGYPERSMQHGKGPHDGIDEPHHFLLGGGQHAQGRHIGADGHEPGVPQGKHAGEPVNQVEG